MFKMKRLVILFLIVIGVNGWVSAQQNKMPTPTEIAQKNVDDLVKKGKINEREGNKRGKCQQNTHRLSLSPSAQFGTSMLISRSYQAGKQRRRAAKPMSVPFRAIQSLLDQWVTRLEKPRRRVPF